MDKSKMKQTTIEKMWDGDGWRDNALLTNLPRAFINLGTIMPAWHQISEVFDPRPDWAGGDGLYTVWLTDDDAAPLELEASHEVWLDYSDVKPVSVGLAEIQEDVFKQITALLLDEPVAAESPAVDAPSFAFFQPSYEELVLGVIVDRDEDDDDDYLDEEIFDDDEDDDPDEASFSVEVPGPLDGKVEVDTEGKRLVITIEMGHLPDEFFEQLKNLLSVGKVSFEPSFKITEVA